MKGARLTPRARSDLETIWDHSARTWSSAQADAYLQTLRDACNALAADPKIGFSIHEIREGYRRFPMGAHVIFYREADGAVEIVRVLHQRMDVFSHL